MEATGAKNTRNHPASGMSFSGRNSYSTNRLPGHPHLNQELFRSFQNVLDLIKFAWLDCAMRTIEISTAVFAAIWAVRKNGEETENDILSRMLGLSQPRPMPVGRSIQTGHKVRWIDDVLAAFDVLGGRASYADLYKSVREIRAAAGRSLPASTDAIIRREVENHASQSDAFTHKDDLFEAPLGLGAGVWALRPKK